MSENEEVTTQVLDFETAAAIASAALSPDNRSLVGVRVVVTERTSDGGLQERVAEWPS